MKLGLIQVKQDPGEKYEKRTHDLLQSARMCFEEGADLVFFPECYQYGAEETDIFVQPLLQERVISWKERCSDLAKRYHAYVVPWDYETGPEGSGKVYNSSYILDRNGNEIGRYRKTHLPYSEIPSVIPGDDFPVFDLDFGRIGIMICWDNYFPESARILANRGAKLILYPLYGDTMKPQWDLRLRARAADNCVYIAPEQIDRYFDTAYTGLVSPEGEVLHRITSAPSHLTVGVDMEHTVTAHTSGSDRVSEDLREYLMKCRNTKAYGGILEDVPVKEWGEIVRRS